MTGRASSVLAGMVLAGALGALWLPDRLAGYDGPRMAQSASAAAADDLRATICAPGYARSQRLPPERYYPIAEEAYRRAGIPWSQRRGHILDHLVPLCLGGTWDQSNLQVQTIAAAAEKDRLEVATCKAYCAGEIDYGEAVRRFKRTSP